MGIGGGIFLIAIGAILSFAIHAPVTWININVVGYIMMTAGAAVSFLTLWFWRDRRRRRRVTLSEQAQAVHQGGPVIPDTPENETRFPQL